MNAWQWQKDKKKNWERYLNKPRPQGGDYDHFFKIIGSEIGK
jgi:hypothetical protein